MKRERNDAVQTVFFLRKKNFAKEKLKIGVMSVVWNLFLCITFDLSLFRGSLTAFYRLAL